MAYQSHPLLVPLPDDTVMWRYMNFTKLLSLMEKKTLYFCRADLLGDPFEGSIPNTLLDYAPPGYDGPRDYHEFDISNRRTWAYVNCWHEGTHESEAMWKLYAGEKDGIAIKTVFSKFREALVDEHDIFVSRVQYKNYQSDVIPFSNILQFMFYKRISFRHEQEIRAVVMDIRSDMLGLHNRVEVQKLVDEIVVSPLAEEWFMELVRSVADRYDLSDRVVRSSCSDKPNFKVGALTEKSQ